jgi:hypothetical protein
MKKLITNLEHLSKWYGTGIILLYSLLMAEFFSTVNHLFLVNNDLNSNSLFTIFSRINYSVTILSGIVVWIISMFIFHLTALLFNGKSSFKRFLYISSYPYIIPLCMILSGILLLDSSQIAKTEDVANSLVGNSSFQLAMNLINYSFIPYYLIIILMIHYVYQIKYLYAFLSVAIPIFSIWGIVELFKFI